MPDQIKHDGRDECMSCLMAMLDVSCKVIEKSLSFRNIYEDGDPAFAHAAYAVCQKNMGDAQALVVKGRGAMRAGLPQAVVLMGNMTIDKMSELTQAFNALKATRERTGEPDVPESKRDAMRALFFYMDGIQCMALAAGVRHGKERALDGALHTMQNSYRVALSKCYAQLQASLHRFSSGSCDDEPFWLNVVTECRNVNVECSRYVLPEVVQQERLKQGGEA